MKSKKILLKVLAFTMVLSLSTTVYLGGDLAYAEENATNVKQFHKEIIRDDFFQETNLPNNSTKPFNLQTVKSGNYVIHNNGKGLINNLFKKGESAGNYLIAVTFNKIGNTTIENDIFANKEFLSKEELNKLINESNQDFYKIENLYHNSQKKYSPILYKKTWNFYEEGKRLVSLTDVLTGKKLTHNGTYNGTKCSVWDVTSFNEIKRYKSGKIINQYTRLDAGVGSQKMVAYGPSKSTSVGTATVSLSGAGIPSASYSFSLSGINMSNKSNLAQNYGRWKITDVLLPNKTFTSKPGIRAVNRKGAFAIELSHSTTVASASHYQQNKKFVTGIVTRYFNDR